MLYAFSFSARITEPLPVDYVSVKDELKIVKFEPFDIWSRDLKPPLFFEKVDYVILTSRKISFPNTSVGVILKI